MKTFFLAARVLMVLTAITGLAYPVFTTLVTGALFAEKSGGSMVKLNDRVVGSALIAQEFKEDRYFWPRPSAASYNPLPSGGTNLGPTSQALREKTGERAKMGFQGEMASSSASGLDPHISPDAALAQAGRVAKARGKSEEDIRRLVAQSVERRQFGFLGERRVNVLKLNLLLDQ
jgi:K+-transporting ATPase ATPase C chain